MESGSEQDRRNGGDDKPANSERHVFKAPAPRKSLLGKLRNSCCLLGQNKAAVANIGQSSIHEMFDANVVPWWLNAFLRCNQGWIHLRDKSEQSRASQNLPLQVCPLSFPLICVQAFPVC